MTTRCRLLAVLVALLAAGAVSAAPVITWASDPVGPDETVVLLGGGFASGVKVEVARLDDATPGQPTDGKLPEIKQWSTVAPLQVTPQSLKFVLPKTWSAGIYAVRVAGPQPSVPVVLNCPDPWWLQGDEGQAATPGGWMEVFGKCLDFRKQPTVVLRNQKGQDTSLKPGQANCWAVAVDLPEKLAPGTYSVFVHNGYGGPAAWRSAGTVHVIPPVAWKTEVFQVPQPQAQEGEKLIRQALAKAEKNGGGIVALSRGVYDVKDQLVIPPHTILRGAGMGLTSLYYANTATPPEAWITGHDFGLQDLDIYCFNYQTVVADTQASQRLRLSRVRIRAVPDAVRSRLIKPTKQPFATIHLLGRNFQVTNCDLYADLPGMRPGRAIVTGPYSFTGQRGPWYGVIADNIIYGNMYGCENIKDLIYQGNQVQGASLGATTYWNNFAQNLYFADNQVRDVYGGDREIMTFDAGGGAYFGKLAACDGTHLTLAGDPQFHDYAPTPHTDYRGAAVMILNGTGAGQYRFVTANQGRSWRIDRPFAITPDSTSLISIAPFRGRNLFVNNTFTDGGAVQLYGSALDVIVAGNRGMRIDGFFTWGLNPHNWGWQPTWRCQFLGNELAEGSGFGARVWGPAFFGIATGGSNAQYSGPLARATIFRHDILQTQSCFRIGGVTRDTLVEDCTIRHSAVGIHVDKTATDTVLRHNHFEDVAKPLDGEGINQSCVVEASGQ